MSYQYTEEYLAQLRAAQAAQAANNSWDALNVIRETQPELSAYDIINRMPDFIESDTSSYGTAYKTVTFNSAGEAIGVDFVDVTQTVQNPPAVIDSNVGGATYGTGSRRVMVNGSAGGTGSTTFSKGAKILSTELPTNTLASRIGLGVAAVSLGTKLGKLISTGIYELGGGWQYDPANWSTMLIGDDVDELDKAALRILFGLDENTGSVTPYLNSDALGAMYLMMLNSGAFDVGGEVVPDSVPEALNVSSPIGVGYAAQSGCTYGGTLIYNNMPLGAGYVFPNGAPANLQMTSILSADGAMRVIAASTEPFVYKHTRVNLNTGEYQYQAGNRNSTAYTFNNETVYYSDAAGVGATYGTSHTPLTSYNPNNYNKSSAVAWALIFGTIAKGMDGVEDDTTGATYFPNPNTITGTDLNTVNQQLRQNYPQLYDGEIYEDVPQPDGTTKRITYIPVPYPNTSDKTKPITGDNHQNNPTSNPTTNNDDQLDDLIDLITQLLTPNLNPNPNIPTETPPPDTGSGDSPPVITPTGSASSLWAVYNPTQAQVDAFGSWLWSSDLVDQIKKLFNDPMQAIIGIHKVFATPATGETSTIVCGYIDSEVPSKIVTSQYTTIDCGTVNLREYFGNVFDYAPFTEVSLYLPFIGIVKLDVTDVMRASINVKYHVDVITGACLADVVVNRDGAGGVLYQYSGSAIVTYPISSGSYASAIGGILSIAGGIAATVMTGGAAAPAVLGAAAGLSHLHSDVQKSGSFTGAAGAMGAKKPYLIISRPQIGMPSEFAHLQGYPVNYYTKLGDCSGHVRVRDVQVKGMNASDTELDMIRDTLLQGVEI